MEYLDGSSKPSPPTVTEEAFDRLGEAIEHRNEKSYAKTKNANGHKTYYVMTHRSALYDPWGMHGHREDHIQTQMQKVSLETFDFYMLFLKTRNSLYLTRAQRSFIND